MQRVQEISFAALLPSSLAEDPTILAAAAALDRELAGVNALLEAAAHLQRLDELRGAALTLLAWQMSVDVWDEGWSDEVKRDVIRAALPSHRRKGTPWSVREACRAVGVDMALLEWMDHADDVFAPAEPYTFALEPLSRPYTEADHAAALDAALAAKNVRSHLSGIVIRSESAGEVVMRGVAGVPVPVQGRLVVACAASGGTGSVGLASFIPHITAFMSE
jgi:phage tail P2-like protein